MKPLGSGNMKRFLALLIAFLLVVNCSVSVAATESEELLWNLSDVIYMDYNIEDIEKTEDFLKWLYQFAGHLTVIGALLYLRD